MSIILEASNLVKEFEIKTSFLGSSKKVHAVSEVSLTVNKGETFAIVGESGCGKSTLARLLARLLTETAGDVYISGKSASNPSKKVLKDLRSKIQFIFQDPFSSLNPRMSVESLITEPMEVHRPELSRQDRLNEARNLLSQVGLRSEQMERFPHEFSGGQRQRISIARALAAKPEILVGDEPVSALDVSVQAQVINLLSDLKDTLGLTLIIVAHDLAVVRHMSDKIAVMYLGRIVEIGPADEIIQNPQHPYTQALISAVPEPSVGSSANHIELDGDLPSPKDPPSGCRFRTRCKHSREICSLQTPQLVSASELHQVACHFFHEIEQPTINRVANSMSEATERRIALFADAVSSKNRTVTKMGEY